MKYVFLVVALLMTFPAVAQPVTPADVIHPNIHKNNGPGNAACPHADNPKCNNMHGIANNPGQSGVSPSEGAPGFRDQLNTVHGGILDYTGGAAKRSTETTKGKAGKGKAEKVLLCHYEEADVFDENGVPVLDDAFEPVTEVVTFIISVPERAAAKHLNKHGDVPLVTGDAEADALALAACQELLAEDTEADE